MIKLSTILIFCTIFFTSCFLMQNVPERQMQDNPDFYPHILQEKETLQSLAILYTGNVENWKFIDYANKNNPIRVGGVVWIPRALILKTPLRQSDPNKGVATVAKKPPIPAPKIESEPLPEAVEEPSEQPDDIESTDSVTPAIQVQETDNEIRERLLRSLLEN